MDIPDPVQRAKDRLAELGDAAATEAVTRARANREGGFGGRSLGFAVAREMWKGDGVNYLVVVTDGEQEGVVVARLTRSLLASLNAREEDPQAHLIERLQGAVGSLKNDGNRWLNIILQPEPITFTA